jgi:hypothetical protein
VTKPYCFRHILSDCWFLYIWPSLTLGTSCDVWSSSMLGRGGFTHHPPVCLLSEWSINKTGCTH